MHTMFTITTIEQWSTYDWIAKFSRFAYANINCIIELQFDFKEIRSTRLLCFQNGCWKWFCQAL